MANGPEVSNPVNSGPNRLLNRYVHVRNFAIFAIGDLDRLVGFSYRSAQLLLKLPRKRGGGWGPEPDNESDNERVKSCMWGPCSTIALESHRPPATSSCQNQNSCESLTIRLFAILTIGPLPYTLLGAVILCRGVMPKESSSYSTWESLVVWTAHPPTRLQSSWLEDYP